ncbi:LVIVD repeat-containing protein [Aegicerativicinus sediminis]|uniref:LVIVD repeat-containing protein n=1 Tax=Aegicerativicinus sediminis TaxID=2893202 RepID=UPI001E4F228F|nr:hypothetical protein [Aegicerativicinus sediminis]
MKPIYLFVLFAVLFSSCQSDDSEVETITVATPVLISKSEFRSSVEVQAPHSIEEAGKIYAYKNYIFINDNFEGIHVIDNTNPQSPQLKFFIKVPGNVDISIKADYLYADSATDLLVFNIGDINNIKLENRVEDVFDEYNYNFPEEASYADFGTFNPEMEVIVGWELTKVKQEVMDERWLINEVATNSASGDTGQGGSLARFQVVKDKLYTVDLDEMFVFDLSNLSSPTFQNKFYAGFNVETMFYADDYLYLGSSNGMYIYGLEDAANPNYISEFTHWESCDPVVVDGDVAYVTLRGGNMCGVQESALEVIDISDKTNPTLANRYLLENPYGLGIAGNALIVCDGNAGLKMYNRTNPKELSLISKVSGTFAKDVIPLEDKILVTGDSELRQYKLNGDNLQLLSILNY